MSVVGERSQMYVGGAWVGAASGKTMRVTNPATGEALAELPDAGRDDAWKAVDEAAKAFAAWAATPGLERGKILRRIFELMTEQRDDLARLVTEENGKPFDEARREVAFATGYFWITPPCARSRSRVRLKSANASWPGPASSSSASRLNWAGTRPSSCSTMRTWRRPPTARWGSSSCGWPASRASAPTGFTFRRASPRSLSPCSSSASTRSRWRRDLKPARRSDR